MSGGRKEFAGLLEYKSMDMRGFTLLELAVTLFIVTLLLGGVLVPLQTQMEIRKSEETQRLLEQAREALLGYAASYGYFPCPADAASGGQEPAVGVNHGTGVCPSYYGFLACSLIGCHTRWMRRVSQSTRGAAAPPIAFVTRLRASL